MLQTIIERIHDSRLIQEALGIWVSGGWAMGALAVNSMILFGVGVYLWLNTRGRWFSKVPESTWRSWIGQPERREGKLGHLIEFLTSASDLDDLGVRVSELHATELAPFRRDLKFIRRCVSTAPLLGLLGTVTGMLTTFSALATGSGGDKTMDMVAGGISEALITTETGLVIALPGLFFQYYLTGKRDKYEAFLAHLETACTQYLCAWTAIKARSQSLPQDS
jgi:biopolymer transport protein ExbB